MSVVVLSNDNFQNVRRILRLNLRGNYLVYFKIHRVPECESFDPIFRELVAKEKRINFATIDVGQYKDVVKISQDTNLPISGVPLLAIYLDGIPKSKFGANRNIDSMRSHITDVLSRVQEQNQFVSAPAPTRSMYGGGDVHGKAYHPEMAPPPSMKGALKAGAYQGSGLVDHEEEPVLMTPDGVIPHNTPWEATQ